MEKFDLAKWALWNKKNTPSQTIDRVVIDSRMVEGENSLFFCMEPGFLAKKHTEDALHRGSKAVISSIENKKIFKDNPFVVGVENPLAALQDLAKTYRQQFTLPLIAILGGRGKTSVKNALEEAFNDLSVFTSPESFNSQIGVALSLFHLSSKHEIGFIEVSASLPGEMALLGPLVDPETALIIPPKTKEKTFFGGEKQAWGEYFSFCQHAPHLKHLFLPKNEETFLSQCAIHPYREKELYISEEYIKGVSKFFLTIGGSRQEIGERESYSLEKDLLEVVAHVANFYKARPASIQRALQESYPFKREICRDQRGFYLVSDTPLRDPFSLKEVFARLHAFPSRGKRFLFFDESKNVEPFKGYVEALSKDYPSIEVVITNFAEGAFLETFLEKQKSLKKGDILWFKAVKQFSIEDLIHKSVGTLPKSVLRIDLGALKNNISYYKKNLLGEAEVMFMSKAHSYGTDDAILSAFLWQQGVKTLGTAYLEEALFLKELGVPQNLFVLNLLSGEEKTAIEAGVEIGVSTEDMIERLGIQALSLKKQISVHLHVDTGMGRFGCRPEEVVFLAEKIKSCPSLNFKGFMSHLTESERKKSTQTRQQIRLFRSLCELLEEKKLLPEKIHLANSYALLNELFKEGSMVRMGIALFGPHKSVSEKHKPFILPAVHLSSKVVGINYIRKGESVGYGSLYKASQDMHVAVLSIGYFDGIRQPIKKKELSAIIRGCRAPLVGKVCMDYLMVDITDIEGVKIGDEALFFGVNSFEENKGILLEECAEAQSKVPHEIISSIGPRVQRIFIDA